MRPPVANGWGALLACTVLVTATVLGTGPVEGVRPLVSRPPEEARFRPVTLPTNTPFAAPGSPADVSRLTPMGPPAPRELLGDRTPEMELEAVVPPELPNASALPELPSPTPKPTPTAAPNAWRFDPEASWYGPGFYGKRTACGLAMTRTLVGVAHRSLPCGTMVVFRYNGRTVRAPVVDRGPYVDGRTWDLTAGLAIALDHLFTGPVEWRLQ